ncbi:hypothetical protein [Amycolatopsis sp. PS_44_ISF1]|uniref:hypothetical protein n=1 Tax=Amycolatopsis sp. PS_44_ISF1 TaxID=2974917 RepID=UPI0028DD4A17|nr:hypothetical protein [Amycolatopsis sp. PS_44_ISF1]MDT8911637.1 hypothetical protein [Amycolatopsis sp. PS_44_ISF1]
MRELTTPLPAAPELLEPEDAGRREAIRRKAALAVAARADDAQDCARLLEMLGLRTPGEGRSEVA